MHEAQQAFWDQVTVYMPVIVGAVVTVVLALLSKVAKMLGGASREGVAVVERLKRNGARMTPTEQKAYAVQHTRKTMGVAGSILPPALVGARIQDVVDSGNAMQRAKSDPPELARPSGEHETFGAVDIPRRSPTGFSGDKFPAVTVPDEPDTDSER